MYQLWMSSGREMCIQERTMKLSKACLPVKESVVIWGEFMKIGDKSEKVEFKLLMNGVVFLNFRINYILLESRIHP